jgi:hypothetical protein
MDRFFKRRSDCILEVSITKRRSGSLHLVVEPWAREITVPSNGVARVEFEGPSSASLELESDANGIVIYG